MKRAAPWMLLITGTLLILSALAHAFLGWRAIRGALIASHAPGDLTEAIGIGWLYGSAAMAAFGVIVLMVGASARAGDLSTVKIVFPIGITYLIFGTAAFLYSSLNPHFLGFIVLGLLATGAPFALTRESRRRD